MAENVATAPDPVEAPDECIAVHGADGTPSDHFVVCDSATADPGDPRRRAIADPVNALALAAPRLLPATEPRTLNGNFAVRPMSQFRGAFATLTGKAFGDFTAADWANCVVAGGAIVTCLSGGGPTMRISPNSDVDLFLYGLDEAAARRKIESLFTKLKRAEPTALALRTPHTITVVLPSPKRIVQIVLNLHQTAADVINAFDVDVCGCYYDGTAVHATRRCARAFATRVNLAVPSRRSWTYETRLIKYVKRGFAIGVPGLREADVNVELDGGGGQFFSYGYDSPDEGPGNEGPGMFDYMGADGCRKLLIANMAGRDQFKREGRRTKFLDVGRDTMALAEFLMATDDPYGPSLPAVPPDWDWQRGKRYAVAPNITQFTRGPMNGDRGCDFVVGGIKTGNDAGFAESEWFDGCYEPKGANASRPRAGTGDY